MFQGYVRDPRQSSFEKGKNVVWNGFLSAQKNGHETKLKILLLFSDLFLQDSRALRRITERGSGDKRLA